MKVSDSHCSVVIRCYNEEQHIGRLLSGVMQQMVRDVAISEWWGENKDQIKTILRVL